ncbi:AMP-binding protein [Crocinitomicaceae bacterium]|nr:AMP-binding protein [Crocinitomicaceae bacterium]MDC0099374.1 AMP-binding protein [Crocinitomicaceae bacterium]MDC1196295.1 AMP-binding protein [Crocinitomicaceae bacterium]|tara:strand:+ start:8671 stop:10185 length:1515 start_codon:yes stop_codon:yes gene_type:complete
MIKAHHTAFDDIVHSLDSNRDKIALIDKEGVEYTYSEFKQMITGTRAHLESLGVKKGSKVLVFITMSAELYAVLEALFSLGAVTIFLDPWMKGRKMEGIIRDVKPDLLLLNKKASKYSWLLVSTWSLKKWKIKSLPRNNDEWKIEEVKSDDSALTTFTSGSTGNPKGANRTYAFIDAQAKALKAKLIGKNSDQNVDYTNLPIVALAGFAIGNTVVIPKINLMKVNKANSKELIEHIHGLKVSRLVVSPSLLKEILKGIKSHGIGSINHIVTGGAPISSKLINECMGHSEILFESMYGSTEVEPISGAEMRVIFEAQKNPLKGLFVGTPDALTKVVILTSNEENVDAQYFSDSQLPDGEIGEIVVTGDHVNKNYYKNAEAFARYKIIDSEGEIWHRTGDIGYLENNIIYLVGRENRIMKKGKDHFYPFPIEQFIQREFGVEDIGYLQNKLGEFVLHIGSDIDLDKQLVKEKIENAGYPIDHIEAQSKPLPRDPRHKSKLLVEELI